MDQPDTVVFYYNMQTVMPVGDIKAARIENRKKKKVKEK